MADLRWSSLENTGEYPTSRQGHSLTYYPKDECYLMYGGFNTKRLPELWLFHSRIRKWEKPRTKGKQPNARSYHAAWLEDDYLYIFGGKSEKPLLNDMFVLNLERMEWKRCCLFEPPQARQYHCVVKLQDKKEALLYGGSSPTKNFVFSDLWIVNTAEVKPDSKVKQLPGVVWQHLKQSGDLPGPRTGHAMTQIPDTSFVYLHGGSHKIGLDPTPQSESEGEQIFRLQIVTGTWTKINVDIQIGRRAYHNIAMVGTREILIFGGEVWGKEEPNSRVPLLFNTDTLKIEVAFRAQPLPQSRHRFAMASSGGWAPSQIVIIGGLDKQLLSMDPLVINWRHTGVESPRDSLSQFSPKSTFSHRRSSMKMSPRGLPQSGMLSTNQSLQSSKMKARVKWGLVERSKGDFMETDNTKIAKSAVSEKRHELAGLRQAHSQVVETLKELQKQRATLGSMIDQLREEHEQQLKNLKMESTNLQKQKMQEDRQFLYLKGKLENEKQLQTALSQKILAIMEFFQKQESFLIQLDKLRFKTQALQVESTHKRVEVDEAQLEEQRAGHLSKLIELSQKFPILQHQEAKLREHAELSEKELSLYEIQTSQEGTALQPPQHEGDELMLSKIESEETEGE